MRDIRHGETEMESGGIPHRRLAQRQVRMHRERGLNIGECRDDHAPDALHRVDWQNSAMTLYQPAHHVRLARRAEGGADFLGLLHGDQAVDNVTALHQEVVNLLVDAVDLDAQFLQRGRSGGRDGHDH